MLRDLLSLHLNLNLKDPIYVIVVKLLFAIAIFLQENTIANYNHFSNSFLNIALPQGIW